MSFKIVILYTISILIVMAGCAIGFFHGGYYIKSSPLISLPIFFAWSGGSLLLSTPLFQFIQKLEEG